MSRHSLRGPRWEAVRAVVLERDGQSCVYCGATQDLTADHIVPLNLFTADDWTEEREYDPDNLVTLCRSCNGRKSDRLSARMTWFNRKWLDRINT